MGIASEQISASPRNTNMMIAYILGLAVCCFVLERLVPGWKLPAVRTWPYRVVLVNCFQLGVVLLAGISWERWLSG